MLNLERKICASIQKFDLNLQGKTVLTEAASGNYVVTPVIAAFAGANVTAITKDSKYGSIEEIKNQTYALARQMELDQKIRIVDSNTDLDYDVFDIVTNTGFVRPINQKMISMLKSSCVIPLMWEPWEFRSDDIDLNACYQRGIKVYGTNESDQRLRTMEYIGFTVLSLLLENKHSPFSANILLLGNQHFVVPVEKVLHKNNYSVTSISQYDRPLSLPLENFNVIVVVENERKNLLIGERGYIASERISADTLVIHICGNVDFNHLVCSKIPQEPAKFGYMSYTTDYVDNQAVIDLHTAGLKVAEGMLRANKRNFEKLEYKNFMEKNYPALAFSNEKFW